MLSQVHIWPIHKHMKVNNLTEKRRLFSLRRITHEASHLHKNRYGNIGFVQTSKLIIALLLAFFALLSLNIIVIYGYQTGSDLHDNTMLYFDTESNLPSYYNSFILLVSSLLLLAISTLKRSRKDPYALHWLLLAAVFFVLSVDEAVSLHERLIDPLRAMYAFSGVFRFAWIVPGTAFVLFLGLLYYRFLLHLPRPFLIRFLAAGGIFFMGSVGMEMPGGYFLEHVEHGRHSLAYMACVTLEESLEMIGVLVFISALLKYLRTYFSSIQLTLKD